MYQHLNCSFGISNLYKNFHQTVVEKPFFTKKEKEMAASVGMINNGTISTFDCSKRYNHNVGSRVHHFSSNNIMKLEKWMKSADCKVSTKKPLHISSVMINGFGNFEEKQPKNSKKLLNLQCNAYEASNSRSQPIVPPITIEINEETSRGAGQKIKIGIYFATWWTLNVIFNIYNKKVLNAFPFPWLTSTLSLATGSLLMLISWATKIAEPPKTDLDFWKTLFPVSVFDNLI